MNFLYNTPQTNKGLSFDRPLFFCEFELCKDSNSFRPCTPVRRKRRRTDIKSVICEANEKAAPFRVSPSAPNKGLSFDRPLFFCEIEFDKKTGA